jgi:hypothetical protein
MATCDVSKSFQLKEANHVKNSYDIITSSSQETAEKMTKFFRSVYV